jgi:hypothetical protein
MRIDAALRPELAANPEGHDDWKASFRPAVNVEPRPPDPSRRVEPRIEELAPSMA